jgi:GntR family transcriptional regulator, galactonate operon transcriptional repressor
MAASPVEADVLFHRALLAASGNELLRRMEMVLEPGLAARDRLVHSHPVVSAVELHRAVLEAVRQGDAAQAERAMRVLLERAAEDVARL